MSTPSFPHHPHETELTWEQLLEALARLEGSRVAVRLIDRGDPETLVAVFRGHLGSATHDKHPTVFWPVRGQGEPEPGDAEDSGIYLYPARFGGGAARAGGTTLVIEQGPLVINVRSD